MRFLAKELDVPRSTTVRPWTLMGIHVDQDLPSRSARLSYHCTYITARSTPSVSERCPVDRARRDEEE